MEERSKPSMICTDCGDTTRVDMVDHKGRCDNCSDEYVDCSVCGTEERRDDLCRHLNEDPDEGWYGSGCDSSGSDSIKKSLFKIFDKMPEGFVPDLATAISSGKFYTFMISCMIGSGLLQLYGMPSRQGVYDISGWGDRLLDLGRDDDDGEMAMGYGWLSSLHCGNTQDANTTTLKWISEYQGLRGPQ